VGRQASSNFCFGFNSAIAPNLAEIYPFWTFNAVVNVSGDVSVGMVSQQNELREVFVPAALAEAMCESEVNFRNGIAWIRSRVGEIIAPPNQREMAARGRRAGKTFASMGQKPLASTGGLTIDKLQAMFADLERPPADNYAKNMRFALGQQWVTKVTLGDEDDPVPVCPDPIPIAALPRPARAYFED